MVKIILILALLQYISNFLFGYKSNALSCGIFGMATNKPENLDVNGVHILGIYNIERGKLSCGLSWDGDVQYGLGLDKLYTDFIIDREIKPIKTPIMIGHTRQPSFGMAITEDNAHPFGFGTSKDGEGYEMIFCHNGTLKNHKELALKYNIDLTEKVEKTTYSGSTYTIPRDKIDSEILGEILYKTKRFHVLSDYVGAAALAWTWIDQPNKLYLWSGASKHTKGSALNNETEERPMNVYCKNENSMFFSSLKNSLTVLGASKKDDLQIDYNTVYIITDGDFANAEKHKVSRKKSGQNNEVVVTVNHNKYDKRYSEYCDWEGFVDKRVHTTNVNKNILGNKQTSSINIINEKTLIPIADYKNKIYFKNLRYYQADDFINGIYIYIKNWGFKLAGINLESSIRYVENIKGKTFNYIEGTFNFTLQDNNLVAPFKKTSNSLQLHYFVDGVMLRSLEDYNQALVLKTHVKAQDKYINHVTLSYMSKHPIINPSSTLDEPLALLDGSLFTGNIVELGFEKVYYFDKGSLTKWLKREDIKVNDVNPVIILPSVNNKTEASFDKELFDNTIAAITKLEKEIENLPNSDITDDITIRDMITEAFEKHAEDVSETLIELDDWKENEIVKGAIDTLKLISHTLKDFVEIPNKK